MRRGWFCLGLVMSASAQPQLLVDGDFAAPVDEAGPGNERVTGRLPAGWRDDTGWCRTWVDYQALEEEGRRFVRIHVARVEEGRCQTRIDVPRITGETFFRLRLTARSLTGAGFQIGLRERGAPYAWVWETRPALSGSWQTFSYEFRALAHDREIGLYTGLEGVADVDLARVELLQLTREDYRRELAERYPDGGPPNLLRSSRLPLGLQSGWMLDRANSDGDDVLIAPDPATPGPSGAPALRLQVREPVTLTGEPFAVPLAFERHTASVFAKGTGELRLVVLRDRQHGAERRFALTDQWQRCELPFDPLFLAPAHALRVSVTGDCWLDGWQVNRGERATPLTARAPTEVALACPASDASAGRIQFLDEPAEVLWAVTGRAGGATLKTSVHHISGAFRSLPDIALADGFLQQGRLRYDALPATPLGPYRIEAQVVDSAGAPLSPPTELVINRLRRPRYWGQDHPGSHFGTHVESANRTHLIAKAVGVNWVRLHDAGLNYIGWYHLERQPGQWTFYDTEIKRYRANHLLIFGELGTAPEWASYFQTRHDGYFDRFYQPRNLADYARYVQTVTTRYKGVITAWDVWNEPWIWAWWGAGYDETQSGREGYRTSAEPQRDFAALQRTAYETAKAIDPTLTIAGFNSTTGGGGSRNFGGREWTAGVLAAGGLETCDVIGYHHYSSGSNLFPDDSVERGKETATGPIREQLGRAPKPIWMTEGSAGRDTLGDGFYHHTTPYEARENNAETADRLCRYVVSLLANGIERIFLYTMHAQPHFGTVEGGWRVLVSPDGYLHPSGAAHAELAWRLEDATFHRRLELAEGVFAYLFAAPGRAVAVLAARPGAPGSPVPAVAGAEVTDLFGNPVAPGRPLGPHLVYLTTPGPVEDLARALER